MWILPSLCPLLKQHPKKRYNPGAWHYSKTDIDNMAKYVLDIAQPILFTNDCIVSKLTAKKVYDLNPRTEFTVLELQ